MERWTGKVAVVTGASSGIGAAICKDLVKAGMIVVGLARRKKRVEALRTEIPSDAPGKLYALQCDVSSDEDIVKAFAWIAFEIGVIHVLVNNAGITRFGPVTGENSNESDLRSTLQTNLWGTIQCTRKAVEIMHRQQIVGAHVVMINSVAGHRVACSPPMPMLNVYPSSKFGVTALTEVLRQEFNADGKKFKVTSISPGSVRTEIAGPEIFNQEANMPILNAEDVSNAVLYVLGTPTHVQISELTIKPVGEQF